MYVLNQKGHALIELVIILPILLFLLIGFFDVMQIKETKWMLEQQLNQIGEQWNQSSTYANMFQILKEINPNATLEIKNKNDESFFLVIKEKVKIHCPGLNRIIDSPYEIKVEKEFLRKEDNV